MFSEYRPYFASFNLPPTLNWLYPLVLAQLQSVVPRYDQSGTGVDFPVIRGLRQKGQNNTDSTSSYTSCKPQQIHTGRRLVIVLRLRGARAYSDLRPVTTPEV
jgi:hypothetical protein